MLVIWLSLFNVSIPKGDERATLLNRFDRLFLFDSLAIVVIPLI
jgi:hypothetical protein